MLIFATCLLLFITALALLVLRATQRYERFSWLAAVGGAALAWISAAAWLSRTPFDIAFPAWQPRSLFPTPVVFRADGISWAFAAAILTLILSILLTAVNRPDFISPISWTGSLLLGGMSVLAVTANNPLTLVLMWAFLDLTELFAQLISASGERSNEQVVIAFSTRVFGTVILFWSTIESAATGTALTFGSLSPGAGVYLVLAAGLRLGVLPLHLPFASESSLRRGFGTALRLIGAAASLSALGRVQIESAWHTPILLLFTAAAALYGGWMWLRSPNALNGRPYWMIGVASLAVLSALSGNPLGAVAWGSALVLAGAPLFLTAAADIRLNRIMLAGVWSLSTLPFSLTAAAWMVNPGLILILAVPAQALIMAGYIRHVLRATDNASLTEQPKWAQIAYPAGLLLPVAVQIFFGFFGWDGARQTGSLIPALLASFLTVGLVWASRRFRIFNPVRAHWVATDGSGVNSFYRWLWSLYYGAARLGQAVSQALEGEGGMMWTLLFLFLFISIITQGSP